MADDKERLWTLEDQDRVARSGNVMVAVIYIAAIVAVVFVITKLVKWAWFF